MNDTMKNKDKVMVMRLSDSQKETIKKIAKDKGFSMTEIVELALIQTFPEYFIQA